MIMIRLRTYLQMPFSSHVFYCISLLATIAQTDGSKNRIMTLRHPRFGKYYSCGIVVGNGQKFKFATAGPSIVI